MIILYLFPGKVFKNSRKTLIFRGLTFDFFSFVKRKANSTIERQKCKGHEKPDRLLISLMEFNYQISQRNKNFTY